MRKPPQNPILHLLRPNMREYLEWVGDDEVEPLPLVGDGFMHQQGITLLYGHGGIGKGMIAMHTIRALIGEGRLPIVLDYEANTWEWQQRSRTMGIRFPVITPPEPMSPKSVHLIANSIDDEGATHCIIDSASTARPHAKDGDFGAADSTVAFMVACRNLGVPVLIIGHQGKAEKNGPLGSVHWRSQSRVVYHAEETSYRHLKVICEKYADGDRTLLTRSYTIRVEGKHADISRDYNEIVARVEKQETVLQVIIALMVPGINYTAKQVCDLLAMSGREMSEDSMRVMLGKLMREGKVDRVARGIYSVKAMNLT